jgi:hypothetical protein
LGRGIGILKPSGQNASKTMSHLIHCAYFVLAHVELFQLMLLLSRRKNKNITTKRVEKQCKRSFAEECGGKGDIGGT